MSGDLLDAVLVVAVVVFGISGWRQGFLLGVLSFAGFLGGGALGAWHAAEIADRWFPSANPAVVGIIVVFLAAAIGQAVASSLASALRRRLTWRPVRFVDSAAGAVVSGASVLLAAWLLASAVAHSSLTGLSGQVRDSRVLAAIDGAMPDSARVWFSSFRRLVDGSSFPQVFGSISPGRAAPVRAPDPAVVRDGDVRAVRNRVVKIVGLAASCDRGLEGSGFVFAGNRVMTNAHVVAGVRRPVVQAGRRRLTATVVLYDPERDVAVLSVPGLRLRPLSFAGPARAGTSAVVAGYPQDGPYTAVPARVRTEQRVRGPDIYQRSTVTREIYALRAVVRPGNSGGPLLSPDGRVYGVVFAAAVGEKQTGYALSAGEVASDAGRGRTATRPVSTGACD